MPKPDKLKVRYRICVLRVENVIPQNYIIEWRRGSKKRSGALRETEASGSTATWNQEFVVSCKYSDDLDKVALPSKYLSFRLRTYSSGRRKKLKRGSVGKVRFNLSDFVKSNKPQELSFSCNTKKSVMVFVFTVQAELSKIGNRRLVPVASGGAYHRGGQAYALESEDNMSETSIDSSSESELGDEFEEEEEEEDFSGEVRSDGGSDEGGSEGDADIDEQAVNQHTKKTVALQQELIKSLKEEVSKQKGEHKAQMKQLSKDIQRLKDDKDKKAKEEYRLQKELMTVKSQLASLTRGSGTKTTIANLTKRVIMAEDENIALKKKLAVVEENAAESLQQHHHNSSTSSSAASSASDHPSHTASTSSSTASSSDTSKGTSTSASGTNTQNSAAHSTSKALVSSSSKASLANNLRLWQATTVLLFILWLKATLL